jgi:uncharacterized damage-inducible protein DinB
MNIPVLEKLIAFNHWSNEQYLATFSNYKLIPERCLTLMSHIIGAEIIWLQRINKEAITPSAFSLKSVSELIQLNKELTAKWLQKINELKEIKEPMLLRYKSLEGNIFNSSIEDIILHVCNHGTYHRAQIAEELRKAEFKVPPTDYIVFTRS